MTPEVRARFEERARVLKALAHPTRLFMVDVLSEGERCVNDLTEMVGADMSTVSKHLSVLRSVGIVGDEKRGSEVYYSLRMGCVMGFFDCVEAFSGGRRVVALTERSMGSRHIVLLLAMVAIALCLFAFGCGAESDDSRDVAETDQIGDSLAASQPDAVVSSESPGGLPVLLDLGADKCVPCKAMAPILEEMRETFAGRLDVCFVDVWKEPRAARDYDVKVIPTQIFLDEDGNELFRHQGFFSREDMLAKWSELGYEFGK